jgi:dethiobiotin synthetase
MLAGTELDRAAIVDSIGAAGSPLVVEGVGGLLVPFTEQFSVADLAVELGLPLLVAAAPGLGTINHTLLTLEAARSRGLRVAAVVLTPWPEEPDEIERSNRETVARLGEVAVATLPRIERADPDLLAQAGAALPLDEWW